MKIKQTALTAVLALLIFPGMGFAQSQDLGTTNFDNIILEGIQARGGLGLDPANPHNSRCAQSFLVMSMLSNLSDGSKRREFMYLYLSRGVGDEVILRVVSPAALGDLNTGSDGDSSAVSFGTGSLKANLGRCIQVNDTSGVPVAPYTNLNP